MAGWKFYGLIALVMVVLFFAGGCNGVLYQKQDPNGRTERLRLDGGEDWGDYDITPRYYSQKRKDQDGYYMMLKSERTF
jgi:hypothetical protein